MAIQILLTGTPGCGKTTLVRRIIERIGDLQLAGFFTQEMRGDDGRRVGFQAIGLNGARVVLASVKSGSKTRVGRYGVELPGFEELIRSELQLFGQQVDLLVIDEIGKMECFSSLFVERMQAIFDAPTPVLATVAIRGGGFISEIKKRAGVELIEVTRRNRDELVARLADRLRGSIRG